MLTMEKLRFLFDYSPAGELVRKVRTSNRTKLGDAVGVVGKRGYKYFSIDGVKHYNHRAIFMFHHGYVPEMIDHIDGNKLNNRIENLRPCTFFENACNTRLRKTSRSGIKGVDWFEPQKKWRARVNFQKKSYHVGYFDNKEAASLAVMNAREKLHKEFARHA